MQPRTHLTDRPYSRRDQRSIFETARRLTAELPMRQRAPWLFLGALGDLWGALAVHKRHRS